MFNKSALFCALFVVLGLTLQLSNATPPACLLGCVNKQPELDDYKAICQSKVTDMFACLKSTCASGKYGDAVDSYKGSCKDQGFSVSTPTNVSSNTSEPSTTPTGTTVPAATTPATTTPVGNSSSPTPTGTGSHNGNGASASTAYNSMLALIAVFAAAAVTL